MGVRGLWDVLIPTGQCDVPVASLSGQTIAVDLSVWIVELKAVGEALHKPSIFIRSIIYRVLELMKIGIKLVIVCDGRAPDLKQGAMYKRQQQQYGSQPTNINMDRRQLVSAVQECSEIFTSLGIPLIKSTGEGEATCAYLNAQGLVNGCLTSDSDFFCYGGKTLYRNLRKQNKSYIVDVFKSSKIQTETNLTQRDLVAMAMLLGCDYDKQGVMSVGKEKGMKLMEKYKTREIDMLDRLLGWRDTSELQTLSDKLETPPSKDDHCSRCKHLGRINGHRENGCSICHTSLSCSESCDQICSCDWCKIQQLKAEHELEIKIRQKAIEDESFPNKQLVKEFLEVGKRISLDASDVAEKQMDIPRLFHFIQSLTKTESTSILDKLVPAYIHVQLMRSLEKRDIMFTPIRILKTCKPNHVQCYRVTWDKTDCNTWATNTHSTDVEVKIEQALFARCYPTLVKQYVDAQTAPKKPGKRKKSKPDTDKFQSKLTMFTSMKKHLPFTETSTSEFVSLPEAGTTVKSSVTQLADFVEIASSEDEDITDKHHRKDSPTKTNKHYKPTHESESSIGKSKTKSEKKYSEKYAREINHSKFSPKKRKNNPLSIIETSIKFDSTATGSSDNQSIITEVDGGKDACSPRKRVKFSKNLTKAFRVLNDTFECGGNDCSVNEPKEKKTVSNLAVLNPTVSNLKQSQTKYNSGQLKTNTSHSGKLKKAENQQSKSVKTIKDFFHIKNS